MKITVINEQDALIICSKQVEQIVEHVLKYENCQCDEVIIHFVNDQTICQLHLQYFDDDSLTDCITFPIDEEEDSYYRLLGEVLICPYTAILYAEKNQKDPYLETTLYLIHGLLHLLGYDDIENIERKKMRQAEKRNMKNLAKLGLELKPNPP